MEQYNVTGMSCAACSTRVEKAVSAVPGVTSCAVSLLTNSMGVEGSASPAEIIKAVEDAGYGASLKGADKSAAAAADGIVIGSAFVKIQLDDTLSTAEKRAKAKALAELCFGAVR